MGTHSDPRSLTSSRILIGTKEREVTSLADVLGFIRECDGDALAELLSSQAQDVDATDGQVILALKGRLEAFRHVLAEEAVPSA
ncbi:hypothetical protein [Azorhizobium sp. AG788]|uniref:hypothetical protein n=1 Tax=Azorhizobium sp. AG788 TaxID=2183897 RepID=UPI0031393E33